MSDHHIYCRTLALATVTLLAGLGCEMLHNAGVPGLEMYVKEDPAVLEEERTNRENFSLHQDHKALYWLLANRVSNGMRLTQVEEILGAAGEFTTELNQLKSEGLHPTNDPAYKWGPDNKGYSVILFFRDGGVSNFNPKDYRTP